MKSLNWKANGLNQNRIDQNIKHMTKILKEKSSTLTRAYGNDEQRVIKVFRGFVSDQNTALSNFLFYKQSPGDHSGPVSITMLVELDQDSQIAVF